MRGGGSGSLLSGQSRARVRGNLRGERRGGSVAEACTPVYRVLSASVAGAGSGSGRGSGVDSLAARSHVGWSGPDSGIPCPWRTDQHCRDVAFDVLLHPGHGCLVGSVTKVSPPCSSLLEPARDSRALAGHQSVRANG